MDYAMCARTSMGAWEVEPPGTDSTQIVGGWRMHPPLPMQGLSEGNDQRVHVCRACALA